jgi:hypothetical protein
MTIQELVKKPPSVDTIDMVLGIERVLASTNMLAAIKDSKTDPKGYATGFAVAVTLINERGMPDLSEFNAS